MNTLVGGGDSHPDHNDAMSQEITVQTAGARRRRAQRAGPHLNLDSARRRQRCSAAPRMSATQAARFRATTSRRSLIDRGEDTRRGGPHLRRRTCRSADRSSATSSGSSASHRNVGNNNIVANSSYPGRIARHLRSARPQLHAAADTGRSAREQQDSPRATTIRRSKSAICSRRAPTCCWHPRAGRRC